MKNVRTVERTITPEMASSLLATNAMNRPVSKSHVARLAGAMTRGEWDVNGTTIKVADTGRLLDGQHRLLACLESGCSFKSLVVYGLEESSFQTIDQNSRSRNISDVLSIECSSSMKNVSAALFVMHCMREIRQVTMASGGPANTFTVNVARDILRRHPSLVESVCVSNSILLFRNAQCAALHYLFGMVDPDLGGEFAEVMKNGSTKLKRPFNVFREGLIRLRNASATPNRRDAAARAIKAFNAERSGKTLAVLSYRSNEDFPLIDGLDYETI
jgi:hypothetical protein